MAITCFIRCPIDPFQRTAFARYAQQWLRIIPRCGGRLVGCFLPHEGSNDIAWGLIGFDSLADDEACRARLKADADGRANFERAQPGLSQRRPCAALPLALARRRSHHPADPCRDEAMKCLILLLPLTLVAGAAVAAADADLLRCRALADRNARLACYDGLPLAAGAGGAVGTVGNPASTGSTAAAAATASAAAPAVPAGPGAAALAATGTATTAARSAPALPAAATTASPVTATDSAAGFGLPEQAAALKELTSALPGRFEGWGPRTRFKLANGQVWQVSDDSSAVYWLLDPQVTIRRSLFGGFTMDIAGVNRQLRVRRVE